MSDQYQQIWNAVFASVFVSEFYRTKDQTPWLDGVDVARRISTISAESIADLAVKKLREARNE